MVDFITYYWSNVIEIEKYLISVIALSFGKFLVNTRLIPNRSHDLILHVMMTLREPPYEKEITLMQYVPASGYFALLADDYCVILMIPL